MVIIVVFIYQFWETLSLLGTYPNSLLAEYRTVTTFTLEKWNKGAKLIKTDRDSNKWDYDMKN